GDDPTVVRLEERVASILGKEAALFFPSGIMANETALQLITRPGTEVIVEATSHLIDWELGAPAALSGVQLRPIATPDAILTAELVEAAIRPAFRTQIRTSAVCMENTHNAAGGRVFPLERMRAVYDVAHRNALPVHLDGSRLWNATAATGIAEAKYAACADTVMVTLSKGLGCPVGSVLAGSLTLMERARAVRRRFGGGMRQSGILAAAGLYALDRHRTRLVDDHRRASRLAELAADIPGISIVAPETNIVMVDILNADMDSTAVVKALEALGVKMVEVARRRVRAVTHLDVDDDGIVAAAAALREVMANPPAR
ncbi:MAG: aminotransferase class I/II-fold pyridoxal phosphate-dependent enzyme, partial [Gemmatimonadetes bacterium]|nr:aminotransferase class I/II-fold pyridoxal phosphate-dependent enzyme [Gemmatimonadota bacterium]